MRIWACVGILDNEIFVLKKNDDTIVVSYFQKKLKKTESTIKYIVFF